MLVQKLEIRTKYPLPESVAEIVKKLQMQVSKLQKLAETHAPNLKFTLDGRLVGDIGEILAAMKLGVTIQDRQKTGYDGVDIKGKKVEIKTTFKDSFAFRKIAERVICIKIHGATHWEIIYDGPGSKLMELFPTEAFVDLSPLVTRERSAYLKSQRQLALSKFPNPKS